MSRVPPATKPHTLPGFPRVGAPRPATAPILRPGGLLANAPTEIALAAVALQHPALALAEAVHVNHRDAVVLIEPGGFVHVLAAGEPLLDALGYSADEVLGDPTALLDEADDIRLIAAYRQALATPGGTSKISFRARGRNGVLDLEASAHNLIWEAAGALVIHVRQKTAPQVVSHPPHNVPQLERVADRETFMQLTQAVIDRKMAKVWRAPAHARAVLRDRRWDYALVLVYLDRFNILLGGFGRESVTHIGETAKARVEGVLRSGDVVAPVGATELAVLIEGLRDHDHINRVADLILDTLRQPIDVGGVPVTLVPIAGIASSSRPYDDAAALLEDAAAAAGRALMRDKGPQHATFETEFRTETVARMSMMAELKDGIDNDELFLLYQPLRSLEYGTTTALEAFVRWQHPTRGVVMPGDFIALAEETGLIRPLTDWVLRAGCRAMASHAPASTLRLHVNIGAAELSEKNFFDTVMSILASTQLEPSRLCLDMSEAALLDNTESAHEAMHRLGARGVRFALDDYGTGASSLRYLADLPFDYVKIDTTLSQGVDVNVQRIVRAMVGLAHELDREVIAEGVESAPQRDALVELGCDEAQGYFFSKPRDAAAIFAELD